jgi:hypothetical protein
MVNTSKLRHRRPAGKSGHTGDLRGRLVDMRAELIELLAKRIDAATWRCSAAGAAHWPRSNSLSSITSTFVTLASIQLALRRLCRGIGRELHRFALMEVCKRNGEGTFVGTHGNGRDAPIPVIRANTIGRSLSTHNRRSRPRRRMIGATRKQPFG